MKTGTSESKSFDTRLIRMRCFGSLILTSPFHAQVQKAHSPINEVVRIGSIIICSKLRKAKLSYCVITLMLYFWWGCRGKLEIDHLITLGSERVINTELIGTGMKLLISTTWSDSCIILVFSSAAFSPIKAWSSRGHLLNSHDSTALTETFGFGLVSPQLVYSTVSCSWSANGKTPVQNRRMQTAGQTTLKKQWSVHLLRARLTAFDRQTPTPIRATADAYPSVSVPSRLRFV